jgi:uncharacterized protein (TIGR03437 family)
MRAVLFLCTFFVTIRHCPGQSLVIPLSAPIHLFSTADFPNYVPFAQMLSLDVMGAEKVGFKLTQVNPTDNGPNFIVVSPAEGEAPMSVLITVNPNVTTYLPPREYALNLVFSTVGTPSPSTVTEPVQLTVYAPPPPSVTSVVSAASLQPAISPGEIVSIFGANVGTPPVSSQYDYTGLYPTSLGNTTVTFGGTPAPLLYVSTTQINAVVPFGMAGQKSVDVVVTHDSVAAPSVSVPIVDTSPAIFTTTQTGEGQGAILNPTGSPNSAGNPAPQGLEIAIFATGGGLLDQNVQDGSIFLQSYLFDGQPAAPVSVTIGGQPAKIFYATAAPYEVVGMLQINAEVPVGIASGAQPVVLTIGKNNNASQQVTVAVK